jgi:hypothetical protein
MASTELNVAGQRSAPDSPEFAGRPPQCHVELNVDGQSLGSATVSVSVDSLPFIEGRQLNFHRFCQLVWGKPARLWAEIADQVQGIALSPRALTPLATVEQNLLKACFLTYLQEESLFLPEPAKPLAGALLDVLIADNTGRLGSQPFIYYPPAGIQERVRPLSRMYNLRLLCRAHLTGGTEEIERFFTPLVVPGIRAREIDDGTPDGREARETWREIRDVCDVAIRRLVERNR